MNPIIRVVTGGSFGAAVGVLLAYLNTKLGWGLSAEDTAGLTLITAHAGALLVHSGIKGIGLYLVRVGKVLWRGGGLPTPPVAYR